MRLMQSLLAAAATVTMGLVWLLPASSVYGQTVTPSADDIAAFRNMSSDQQQAVLQQLGISTGGTGGTGIPGGLGTAQSQPGTRPAEGAAAEQPPEGAPAEPAIPVLKGDDWVIIEIDFQLPQRQLSPAAQLLSSGQPLTQAQQQALLLAAGNAGATPPNAAFGASGTGTATPQTSRDMPPADIQITERERTRLIEVMDLVRSKNPYQLTHDGFLLLPNFAPIALAGLTEEQASLRLRIEPTFRNVQMRLTRLPLKKSGFEGLDPFGYDLFDRPPSTFAPVTNIPVPADYVIGAGDQLEIQLYGSVNRILRLIVGRDGRINFPELGPINVGGQLFDKVKEDLEARIARQMIGVHGSVAMGDTRAIRVFVLGEAKHPGSYTISGLGTITSALFACGGVHPIGSLRNIQLKRQGVLVRRLDLYDLLLRGDTADDTKLLPGDVIFIPPVSSTVAVEGEVRRPAIYEVKNEKNILDIVELAGGLTSEADKANVTLTRIDEGQHRIVLKENVSVGGGLEGLRNGDRLSVSRLRPTVDSDVLVQGHVFTPGVFAFKPAMRLTDVIHSIDELRPDADVHYLLIRRELPPNRHITVLSADLAAALKAPGGTADVALMPRDRIMVFDLASGRDRVIHPLLEELETQSTSDQPTQTVQVDGRVKVPGQYPLEAGMTIADLIRAGGGLGDAAYRTSAELTRYEVVNGESRRTVTMSIDLAAVLRGDAAANIRVQPFDFLSVREVPLWQGLESVNLGGEVRFPGRYPIKRGETLKSVIARAGGLTEYAFPEGSVFTREDLQKREQEQLDLFAIRMQKDLTILALQATAVTTSQQGNPAAALSVGQSLLAQLRSTKAVGRLVIDLQQVIHAKSGSSMDIILRDGDRLIVPRQQQEVSVIGEVQNATSHLYNASLTRDDYISMSGGLTRRADHKSIYVVRANGNVVGYGGNRWFDHSQPQMKPGDTVVVPLDAERLPSLPYWQAVTSILYNVAIAVAAVHAL